MSLTGKRVLIRVDGSHAIGLGHIYRMKALAQGLSERGAVPTFVTLLDGTANRLLQATGLTVHAYAEGDLRDALAKVSQEFRPDWIIQDVLATREDEVLYLKSLSAAKLIHFDDSGAGLRLADVVINAFVYHWGEYAGYGSNTRLYEGAGLMILQKEIESYRGKPRAIVSQARQVTMGFGGTDTHGVTESVLTALRDLGGQRFEVSVILGPGTLETPGLATAVAQSPHKVVVKKGVADLFAEFNSSDLVLCGGGNSLYELATLGIPSLAIACEPHEAKNIAYWEKAGTTIGVGFRRQLHPDFSAVVDTLANDQSRREAMATAGRNVMSDSGLQKVLGILEAELS